MTDLATRGLRLCIAEPEAITCLAKPVAASMAAIGWLDGGKLTSAGRRFYADVIEPDLRFARRPKTRRRARA